MADLTVDTPALQTRGVFEEQGPSDLSRFASGLPGLMPTPETATSRSEATLAKRATATEKLATSYETGADETQRALDDVRQTQDAQAKARGAAKPPALDLPSAPRAAARPFLQPGDSWLSQLNAVLLGVGQLGMQMHGGRGGAIAATAAMKGMLEGWSEGDAGRVKREYEEWSANSERLLRQHKAQREGYQDLLTEQHQTIEEKLQGIRLRAELTGHRALADVARLGNLDATLKQLQHDEGIELEIAKANRQMAQWYAEAQRHERDYLAAQAHRIETEARAREASARGAAEGQRSERRLTLSGEAGARSERKLKLMEDTSQNVIKLEQQEIAFSQRLDNIGRVRDAIALLDSEGILPKGATFIDKGAAAIVLQTKPGRQDIANAVQTIQRLGTPILVGTEVSLGMTGQVLRLKAIGEAEAANVAGIPKSFWDQFLPAAERHLQAQRDMVRRHLEAIGRTAPREDFEILSTTP